MQNDSWCRSVPKVAPRHTTIPYLMKLGLLDSIAIANPVNRRRLFVVSCASLDKFKGEYVLVFEVAAQYDTHTNVVLEALRRRSVKPHL